MSDVPALPLVYYGTFKADFKAFTDTLTANTLHLDLHIENIVIVVVRFAFRRMLRICIIASSRITRSYPVVIVEVVVIVRYGLVLPS